MIFSGVTSGINTVEHTMFGCLRIVDERNYMNKVCGVNVAKENIAELGNYYRDNEGNNENQRADGKE